MKLDTAQLLKTIETYWSSDLRKPDLVYHSFLEFKESTSKVAKNIECIILLSQVMFLRQLNRHIEADEISKQREAAFNKIKNPLFAHRWKRMKMVESFQKGLGIYGIQDIENLVEESQMQEWIEEELRALFLLHLVHKISGNYSEALATLQKVKLLATAHNHQYYLLQCAWGVGHIYFLFGNPEQALQECLNTQKLFSKDYSQPQHVGFYILLGDCYAACNKLEDALKIYKPLLKYIESCAEPDKQAQIAVLSNMAYILKEKKDFTPAIKLYTQAVALAKSNHAAYLELSALINLARIYFQTKNLKKSAETLKNAKPLSANLKITNYELDILLLESLLAKAKKQYHAALTKHEQYHAKFAEWKNLDNTNKLKEIETKHALEQQQLTEQLTKQELKLMEQEMQQLHANLAQKDKLITQFSDCFENLEKNNIQRKMIFSRLRAMVQTVKNDYRSEQTLYSSRFNEAHQQSVENLIKNFSSITQIEAGTAVMLAKGLSNKDIASLTLTTLRNIEKHRLSLRKKMNIERTTDLISFIRKYI